MLKRNLKVNVWITTFILLSVLALAQPPFQQSPVLSSFLFIESFDIQQFIFGEDLQFNFHVFNSSGVLLSNNSVGCRFHIVDLNGFHILETNMFYSVVERDFFLNVSSSSFSTVGTYAYIVNCNSSSNGGFTSASFKVVYSNPVSSELYTGLILFIAFNSLLFAYIGFNFKEEKPSKEQFRLPYLRIFFLAMSLLNVLIGMFLIVISSNADLNTGLEAYLYYIGFIILIYLYGVLEAIFFAKKRWNSIEGDN